MLHMFLGGRPTALGVKTSCYPVEGERESTTGEETRTCITWVTLTKRCSAWLFLKSSCASPTLFNYYHSKTHGWKGFPYEQSNPVGPLGGMVCFFTVERVDRKATHGSVPQYHPTS